MPENNPLLEFSRLRNIIASVLGSPLTKLILTVFEEAKGAANSRANCINCKIFSVPQRLLTKIRRILIFEKFSVFLAPRCATISIKREGGTVQNPPRYYLQLRGSVVYCRILSARSSAINSTEQIAIRKTCLSCRNDRTATPLCV